MEQSTMYAGSNPTANAAYKIIKYYVMKFFVITL
jgi:hypothetical protein